MFFGRPCSKSGPKHLMNPKPFTGAFSAFGAILVLASLLGLERFEELPMFVGVLTLQTLES